MRSGIITLILIRQSSSNVLITIVRQRTHPGLTHEILSFIRSTVLLKNSKYCQRNKSLSFSALPVEGILVNYEIKKTHARTHSITCTRIHTHTCTHTYTHAHKDTRMYARVRSRAPTHTQGVLSWSEVRVCGTRNHLPDNVKEAGFIELFKQILKTVVFSQSFEISAFS